METKACNDCNIELPIHSFDTYPKYGKRYVKGTCHSCSVIRQRKWRKENPEKVSLQNKRANQGKNRRATQKAYMERNPGYKLAKYARRRARKSKHYLYGQTS